MTYCTHQNLIDRFTEEELIQLTDTSNSGAIDYTVLDAAITDASAEIDGYLAKYPLPLAVVPTILTRLCCDIARYFLYDDMAPEPIEKRYERAIEYLQRVAAGKISLGIDNQGQQPTPSEGAMMESGGRVFGRDDKGFI